MDFSTLKSYIIFMRYKRSGSALLACLLDAHPNVIFPRNELMFRDYKKWKTPEGVFDRLYWDSRKFKAKRVFSANGYKYPIEGSGLCEVPYVIGHKSATRVFLPYGGKSSNLVDFHSFIGLPLKFVHLVRNPFNMVAARWMQKEFRRVNAPVGPIIDHLEETAKCNESVWERYTSPEHRFLIRLEDLIKDPAAKMSDLCSYLDLPIDEDHIKACTNLVFEKDETYRDEPPWASEDKDRVIKIIDRYSFFKGYRW